MNKTQCYTELVTVRAQLLAALRWDDVNPMKKTVIEACEMALVRLELEIRELERLAQRSQIMRERAARPWYVRLFSR